MDTVTYALLNKRITSSITGIGSVKLVGTSTLEFTNKQDGSKFNVKLPFDVATIEVVSTLPAPTDKLLNKVYLLLSDDHFYKCVNVSGTYKFKDITPLSSGKGMTVYDDYKSLPTKLDREKICYVKNDYKDTINNTTYKKGFYLYDTTTSKWELISSESALSDYTETITISSKSWYIQHNLNSEWWKLQINIIDNEGNVVYGDVDLDKTTNNLLVLNFEKEIQGNIYIKK